MTDPRSSASLGVGCLSLFLAPFALVGVFAGYQACRAAGAGDLERAGFRAVFAAVFGGTGFGGIALALRGRKSAETIMLLRAAHPEEPWRWRPEWESGRLSDQSRTVMWSAWAFATFWNLLSLPSGVLGGRAALEGNAAAWLVRLFPLIGVGLLAWAIRATLRYRAFGTSYLDLTTRPAVVGRALAGTLRAPAALRPADGFLLTLTALRRTRTGSGNDRSTHERVLWQEERREQGRAGRDAGGMSTVIPIGFRIPAESPSFDEVNPDDAVIWRLTAEAKAPGVDYAAGFDVPVFRTAESARALSAAEQRALPVASPPEYYHPADATIAVRSTEGMTEIRFRAGRNRGAAAGLTAFTAIWWIATWATIHFGAPLIFPIAFGGFGLLLGWFVLDLWTGVSKVRVDRQGVRVTSGWFRSGSERLVPESDIGDVRAAIGMQTGTIAYYDIMVVRRNGRKVTAGRSVRDKREAEWLAATIRSALGRG